VLPALIRRFHEAKDRGDDRVAIWGTGAPRREFLHVDDLADALVFLIERYSDESHVNIGWGEDISIAELAALIAEVVGFTGRLAYATEKPDGMPRKLLDVSMLDKMGWRPKIGFREGLADAYRWFVANAADRVIA
jgi:GDP-L-fucose synthase